MREPKDFAKLAHKLTHHDEDGEDAEQAYATAPSFNPQYGPYPFSIFCAQNSPGYVMLDIDDGGEGLDFLTGPNQDKNNPTYRIEYDNGFRAYRMQAQGHQPPKPVFVGRFVFNSDKPGHMEFDFPWQTWKYNVVNEWWGSDVGLLDGKTDLKWYMLDSPTSGDTCRFVARCFNTGVTAMPAVSSLYMETDVLGHLQISAQLFRTWEQLDEMVVMMMAVKMAFATMVKK